MRKFAIIMTVLGMAFGAYAQGTVPNIDEGTKVLEGSGYIDTDHPLDTEVSLTLAAGKFIRDRVLVAVVGGIQDNDAFTTYEVGAKLEYYFQVEGALVPYVAIGALWAGVEADGGEDNDTAVGQATAGVQYFVDENVSLALSAVYSLAADDIYIDEDLDADDNNLTGEFAVRFFFD